MAFGFSPIIPLQKSEEDGYYALTKTVAANTKQNFKNLLLTSPGERVMIADFGAGLRNYLFSNQYDTIEADITFRIEDQTSRFMPFVEINNIEYARFEPDYTQSSLTNHLGVKIYYSVPSFNFSDMLEINKINFT
jgi:phage baseplate assembly protein W